MVLLLLALGCADDRVDDHEQRLLALEARALQAEQENAALRRRLGRLEQPAIQPEPTPTQPGFTVSQEGPGRYVLAPGPAEAPPDDGGRALLHPGPDGRIAGYRLSDMGPGALPARMGLRNGDVVHTVDGRPLTSLTAAVAAWHAVRDAPTFQVEVTRDGQRRTLHYRVHR